MVRSTLDASSKTCGTERRESNIGIEIWRPSRLDEHFNSLGDAEREIVNFYKHFKGLLNKLSPSNFCVVVNKIIILLKINPTKWSEALDIVAHYAINDPLYRRWYIELVNSMNRVSITKEEDKIKVLFYEKIETLFIDHETNLKKLVEEEKEMEIQEDVTRKNELRVLLEEFQNKIKKQSLGTCLVIGELYKLKMISDKRFKFILEYLMSRVDEISLECTCKLLRLTGECLQYYWDSAVIDTYFNDLQKRDSDRLSSRIRFMLKDLYDLKENMWIPRGNIHHDLNEIDKIFNKILRPKSPSYQDQHNLETIKSIEASDSLLDLAEKKYLDKFKQERDLNELLKNFKDISFKLEFVYACLISMLKRNTDGLNCGRFLAVLLRTKSIDFEVISDGLLSLMKSYLGDMLICNQEKWNGIATVFKILLLEKVIELNSLSVLNGLCKTENVKRHGKIYNMKKNKNNAVLARFRSGDSSKKCEKLVSNATFSNSPDKKKNNNDKRQDDEVQFLKKGFQSSKINSDLNKVTQLQFSTLVKKIQLANCATKLDSVITTILLEAAEKPDLHPWYVQVCKTMDRYAVPCEESNSLKQFRLILLSKCLSAAFQKPVVSVSLLQDQLSIQNIVHRTYRKCFTKVRFICELLKLRQTCENRIFLELFRNCIQILLIYIRTHESLEYLCEFVEEFGKTMETSAAIETMYDCLNNMTQCVFEDPEYLSTVNTSHPLLVHHVVVRELPKKTINMVQKTVALVKDYLKISKPRVDTTKIRSKCAEIFEELLYLNDVKMYAVVFQAYFEPNQMSQVISGIIYEVITFNRHPQAVEICAKLITVLVEDKIITFSQLVDAVIHIVSFDLPTLTSPSSRNNFTEILGLIFSKHRTLFDEFDTISREKLPSKADCEFLTIIKNKLDADSA